MSSTQRFVMLRATLASISVRTRSTVASSSVFWDAWTWQKSLFSAGAGFGCFAGFSAKVAVTVVISVLLSFERRQLVVGFEQQTSASDFNADDLLPVAYCGQLRGPKDNKFGFIPTLGPELMDESGLSRVVV